MMIMRSLHRPNLLSFISRNLIHQLIPPPTNPSPLGLFKVRFPTPNSIFMSAMSSSSPIVQQFNAKEILLSATDDDHGGVIVDMTPHPVINSTHFTSLLRSSVSHWKQQGKKGVWIKLPIDLTHLIESAVKEGFYYHHAEPKYIMLVHWIPETGNTLPANASHRVGIGAFVINERSEVLVVQEKSGRFRGTGIWKFPTGVVEEGEDICDAAVREVKEETGVETKFVEILGFRQSHKAFFDKSDLFFMCMLQPLSSAIHKQETEIEAAQNHTITPEFIKYIISMLFQRRHYTVHFVRHSEPEPQFSPFFQLGGTASLDMTGSDTFTFVREPTPLDSIRQWFCN